MTVRVFLSLAKSENAGMDEIVEALTQINYAVVGLLGLSIVIGIAGLAIGAMQLFSDRPKSSPPGFLYLAAGLPNLISPLLVAYAWSVVVEVVTNRYTGNAAEAGAWISQLLVIAIPLGIVTFILLPAFTFIPFSARRGKKITSIAALAIVVIGIAALAITFIGLADVLVSSPPLGAPK